MRNNPQSRSYSLIRNMYTTNSGVVFLSISYGFLCSIVFVIFLIVGSGWAIGRQWASDAGKRKGAWFGL